jgi:hypothetical protein
MSDISSDQGQGSESPAHKPPAGSAPSPAEHKRSGRKKMLTPVVLVIVGLAMLVAAWLVYPSAAGNPTPGYSELILQSAVPVNYISYDVNRVWAGKADMSVSVVLLPGTIVPAHAATLQVWLPIGDAFAHCRAAGCHVQRVGHQETSYWTRPLAFAPSGAGPAATADFTVRAPDFGATFDGVDASAAIPEVRYCCNAKVLPVLQAGYPISSASNYDWTSFEPEDVTSHSAVWQEELTIGDTASRVAVGTNHTGQQHNDILALIAGTLLALGGGAILAAVQEALNTRG